MPVPPQRRFFRPSMSTRQMQQITLLGIYCSPTYAVRSREGNANRRVTVAQLNLTKEMRETMLAINFRERELRPAARLEDIEDLLRGKGASDVGLSPRILHFSGHGEEASARTGNKGRLLFIGEDDGCAMELDSQRFIELIAKLTPIKNSLECIFLNACSMYESLALPIHQRFPHISVIAYSTPVEDSAAATFAKGFYEFIGKELEAGRRRFSIRAAYDAAEAAWNRGPAPGGGPYIRGDPHDIRTRGQGGKKMHGIYHFLEGVPGAKGQAGAV